MKIDELPDNIDELKKLVQSLQIENNQLKDHLLLLSRRKFAPTSEKDKSQMTLFNEAEDIENNSKALELENSEAEDKTTVMFERNSKNKRKSLPDNLPIVEEILDIEESEKANMKYIGDEVIEKLEITPAKVFIRKIIKKKYAPLDKESGSFKIAKYENDLMPKSIASASLLAYIIVSKYEDALPLYRQEKIFNRIHCELSRQTMARWLIKLHLKLMPLYNLLQDIALDRNYCGIDETTTQVLKEDNKKATSKSFAWVRFFPGDSPIVLFDYAPTRSGRVPIELLDGFKGYLQCDGYAGYDLLCKDKNIIRIGCFDHARRKFFEASKTSSGKNVGKKGIDLIKKLYKIENKTKEFLPDKKYEIRQKESIPILNELKKFIDETREKITPDSIAGKAINYAFNEWTNLTNYTLDGRLNISNILVENAIRPFVIGKKNWLFSASVDGANASMMFYSLIETSKRNEIEPFDYLTKMLDKLPLAKTIEDYENLLPLKGQFLAR